MVSSLSRHQSLVLLYKNFELLGSFILITSLLFLSFLLKFLIQTPFAVEKQRKKKEGFSSYIKEFLEGIKE